MVTKYSTDHGVDDARQGLRRELHDDRRPHSCDARGGERRARRRTLSPAAKYKDPIQSQFGKAGVGGVPMPNIPQMDSVWTDFGQAWVKSTKGVGATKARVAFSVAARSIANKIG